MPYYLAIDAGGTKTDFVLADETHTLARHRTGTIKLLRTDAPTALANLESALAVLTTTTGIPTSAIARTCIGTAGETVPLVANWLRQTFATRVPAPLLLLGDVEIALDAAFRGGPGLLILAGTGSNLAGRTPHGTLATCGGWGPMLADQGSGQAIGARALRATFLAIDESRPTTLQQAILDFWRLPTLESLIEHANRTPTPDTSRLVPLVLQCAEAGDPVARQVLQREGERLAYITRVLIRRLQTLASDPTFLPTLAFAGSIMQHVPPVRAALLPAVRDDYPTIQSQEGVIDPIEGALWRARDEAAFNTRA